MGSFSVVQRLIKPDEGHRKHSGSPSSDSLVTRLPPELIQIILDYSLPAPRYPSTIRQRNSILLRYALVHSSWREYARIKLFQTPRIQTDQQLALFARSIVGDAKLGREVKELVIVGYGETTGTRTSGLLTRLPVVLNECGELERLVVSSLDNFSPLSLNGGQRLISLTLDALQVIALDGWSPPLAPFPHLRPLTITHTNFLLDPARRFLNPIIFPSLTSLRLLYNTLSPQRTFDSRTFDSRTLTTFFPAGLLPQLVHFSLGDAVEFDLPLSSRLDFLDLKPGALRSGVLHRCHSSAHPSRLRIDVLPAYLTPTTDGEGLTQWSKIGSEVAEALLRALYNEADGILSCLEVLHLPREWELVNDRTKFGKAFKEVRKVCNERAVEVVWDRTELESDREQGRRFWEICGEMEKRRGVSECS